MMRILKWAGGLLLFLVAGFLALFFMTSGDYPVARLASDDPALPSVSINGVQLHHKVFEGPDGARTVIVLHGGPGGDFRSLQGFSALSDRYRVVFYDQRGAGLSERVAEGELTLQAHVDELAAVIDYANPDLPPIVIGHSWGAMLATAYIGQHPGRVSAAILIEPGYLSAAGREDWQARAAQYQSGFGYLRKSILTGFEANHVSGPDEHAPNDYLIGEMVHHFANHPDNPYHCGEGYAAPGWRFGSVASRMLDKMPGADLDAIGENAAQFKGPVLLMAGSCNDWIGADLQAEHRKLFANAELAVVENAGHDVVWDNPQETLRIIRVFLDGVR